MPLVPLSHVVSFSSEDAVFKADNLLSADGTRKWKCREAGEKQASCVLQLKEAGRIQSLDLGNAGSAFVEVQVGRQDDLRDKEDAFRTLLASSSFMTPIESRNEQSQNRVRMFGSDKLNQDVASEKWDRIRVVCTQPFNKHIKYGLSFITLTAKEEKVACGEPSSSASSSKTTSLGAFKLKDVGDDDDSDNVGSLFARKAKEGDEGQGRLSAAAELRSEKTLASLALGGRTGLKQEGAKRPAPAEGSAKMPTPTPFYQLKTGGDDKAAGKKARSSDGSPAAQKLPRRNVMPGESPNKDKEIEKYHQKKKEEEKRKKEEEKRKKDEEKKKRRDEEVKRRETAAKERKNGETSRKPAKKTPPQTRPFKKLLDGVVFTISGYQNPLRSNLRQMALNMGAKYRSDWDATCTHLVCAFTNTPKFVQVRAKRGKIVKKEWVERCHGDRKRYPWRRFCLDAKHDGGRDESEDEVWDETLVPGTSGSGGQAAAAAAVADMDTDDEIEAVQRAEAAAATGPSRDARKDEHMDTDGGLERTRSRDPAPDDDYEMNTDDEIEQVMREQNKVKAKAAEEEDSDPDGAYDADTDVDDDGVNCAQRPDTKRLDYPGLTDIFRGMVFFLYGDFSSRERQLLRRLIVAGQGRLSQYMDPAVRVVVTDATEWRKDFDEALKENEKLKIVTPEFVKRSWREKRRGSIADFLLKRN